MTITAAAMSTGVERRPAREKRGSSVPVAGRSGIREAPQDVQYCSPGSVALPHWGQNGMRKSPIRIFVTFAGVAKKGCVVIAKMRD